MDGKKLTLKEEIAKSFEKKSKEKIKFISSLLISNLFVFILCSTFLSPNTSLEKKSEDSLPFEIASPGHEFIVLDVAQTLIAKNNLNKNQFVTILNENKSILVSKAKLISVLESKERDRNEFKFEINQSEMTHLRENLTEKVIVVPFITPSIKEVKKEMVRITTRSKYEVPFKL